MQFTFIAIALTKHRLERFCYKLEVSICVSITTVKQFFFLVFLVSNDHNHVMLFVYLRMTYLTRYSTVSVSTSANPMTKTSSNHKQT